MIGAGKIIAVTAGPESSLAYHAAELAARQSYGRLIAFLAARTGDVALAEDALADAFARALVDWPVHGLPDNPQAWLLTVARRRMVDAYRHQRIGEGVAQELAWLFDEADAGADAACTIPDERLRLMFACAHPALDVAVRAPLILQTTLGLDAATIASAFLVAPSTMSQRLVRAKAKIREARIPFRVPGRDELHERLDTVLEAIYAAFAEGWADPAGTEARQHNLAEEGLWLGRVLASLLPDQAEALGLLALMLHAHARRAARRDVQGDYVPLSAQNPAHWDGAMIDEAEALLRQASRLGELGRFQLEAAVQSAHAARREGGNTDWAAIEQLYAALEALTGSPVVAINRAIAAAHAHGAAAGLAVLAGLEGEARLADYQPYWAARADLLTQSGDFSGAAAAYERAIGLERDPAVRRFLQQRLAGALTG